MKIQIVSLAKMHINISYKLHTFDYQLMIIHFSFYDVHTKNCHKILSFIHEAYFSFP